MIVLTCSVIFLIIVCIFLAETLYRVDKQNSEYKDKVNRLHDRIELKSMLLKNANKTVSTLDHNCIKYKAELDYFKKSILYDKQNDTIVLSENLVSIGEL